MNDVAELFKVVVGLNTVTLTSLILKFWSVGWGSINSLIYSFGSVPKSRVEGTIRL